MKWISLLLFFFFTQIISSELEFLDDSKFLSFITSTLTLGDEDESKDYKYTFDEMVVRKG
jgi:hypothetical protein